MINKKKCVLLLSKRQWSYNWAFIAHWTTNEFNWLDMQNSWTFIDWKHEQSAASFLCSIFLMHFSIILFSSENVLWKIDENFCL
jgi:hypothetical protein